MRTVETQRSDLHRRDLELIVSVSLDVRDDGRPIREEEEKRPTATARLQAEHHPIDRVGLRAVEHIALNREVNGPLGVDVDHVPGP